MKYESEILHKGFVTHDVRQLILSRPEGLSWEPGQGVEIALDLEGWREDGHPFTPTSQRDGPVLEFTIKIYPERDGLTARLDGLSPGDAVGLSDPFGTITHRGPGTFIGGGAGVTPLLAILRHMDEDDLAGSRLFFSNRTPADVICERELRYLLRERCVLTCTDHDGEGYEHRRIDAEFLRDYVDSVEGPFYVCGPPSFVTDVTGALTAMGVDEGSLVVEE